jgi:hypothetical protein
MPGDICKAPEGKEVDELAAPAVLPAEAPDCWSTPLEDAAPVLPDCAEVPTAELFDPTVLLETDEQEVSSKIADNAETAIAILLLFFIITPSQKK